MRDLSEQLDADFDWRMRELAILRAQILKFPVKSLQRQALLRSLWVMLYAHYEGYCKATCNLFLRAIEKERVPCIQLKPSLAIVCLHEKLKSIRDLSYLDTYNLIVNNSDKDLSSYACFNLEERNEKKNLPHNVSSLSPQKLCEICENYGLNLSMVSSRLNETKLRRLVYSRHQIAHGYTLEIDSLEIYEEHEDIATSVMTELALGVIDAIENRTFLRDDLRYS